ncbi:ATP-dependent DNA helicase Q4 [Thelohanellus kitauei]|uniref:DNA 3'-5' helicase n=1 Tax=Thelohanellus kitauei TaxID=669202 RepID=A0A0C2JYF1_THEKT|nr:ATP-dependent DNA helicase Q4 [Thelohanellus kitauei]
MTVVFDPKIQNETFEELENEPLEEEALNISVNSEISNLKAESSKEVENVKNVAKKSKVSENYVKINLKKRKFSKFNKGKHFKWKRKRYYQKLKQGKTDVENNHEMIRDILKEHKTSSSEPEFEAHLSFENMTKQIPIYQAPDFHFEVESPRLGTANTFPECFAKEIDECAREFGITRLKEQQKITITRILQKQTTIILAPTNYGKSLCYQIPALLFYRHFKSLTIVLCPLISLIHDQLNSLPPFVPATTIHSGLSREERENRLIKISNGQICVLLIAPESVIFFGADLFSRIKSVSFVCVDEIHCLSTCSHNFRPSYLQVTNFLAKHLGSLCYIGMTATINRNDLYDVFLKLGVDPPFQEHFIHVKEPIKMKVNVMHTKNKLEELIDLLQTKYKNLNGAMIVFCRSRVTTETVASYIRTKLKGTLLPCAVSCFHAGLSNQVRASIQKKFINNSVSVLVSTSAIGMGLNKRDIRVVIHYDVPYSFEAYLQEIGRGGRDGFPSEAVLFIDDNIIVDMNGTKASVYSTALDFNNIKTLMDQVFPPSLSKTDQNSQMIGIDKSEISEMLDANLETIQTVIIHLENIIKKHFPGIVLEYISSTDYSDCQLIWYSGLEKLKQFFLTCIPVGHYCKTHADSVRDNCMNIDLIELANYFQTDTRRIMFDISKIRAQFKNIILNNSALKIILRVSAISESLKKNYV